MGLREHVHLNTFGLIVYIFLPTGSLIVVGLIDTQLRGYNLKVSTIFLRLHPACDN